MTDVAYQDIMQFTYTNTCSCEHYDEESDSYKPSDWCWGGCWDDQLQDFENITQLLFGENETGWWKISNVRLWDGDYSGFVKAKTAKELLEGMTVRSEWIMRGEIFPDRIEYSLSHHDAPMGSSSVVTIISEEQREQYGLY